jgi:hypothetical protein
LFLLFEEEDVDAYGEEVVEIEVDLVSIRFELRGVGVRDEYPRRVTEEFELDFEEIRDGVD